LRKKKKKVDFQQKEELVQNPSCYMIKRRKGGKTPEARESPFQRGEKGAVLAGKTKISQKRGERIPYAEVVGMKTRAEREKKAPTCL